MGGAIAAAVAVVSIFVVRNMGPATGEESLRGSPSTPGPTLVACADGCRHRSGQRRATPAVVTEPRRLHHAGGQFPGGEPAWSDRQPLAHYVVAHSEQAASAFGFSYDLTQGPRT